VHSKLYLGLDWLQTVRHNCHLSSSVFVAAHQRELQHSCIMNSPMSGSCDPRIATKCSLLALLLPPPPLLLLLLLLGRATTVGLLGFAAPTATLLPLLVCNLMYSMHLAERSINPNTKLGWRLAQVLHTIYTKEASIVGARHNRQCITQQHTANNAHWQHSLLSQYTQPRFCTRS
jgi:hypothetical protein